VDLSESFKTVEHSFVGTTEEKSNVTGVWFDGPSKVDFLPTQMLSDFPQFNGIVISGCQTLTAIKNDLFTKDFRPIQFLCLHHNKIETVESNAFQHLSKLKWISIGGNQIKSLPLQILKNNPELIVVWFDNNQINSITPDIFEGLNKLQKAYLHGNQCINKVLSCNSGSCSIPQSELDSGLLTCFGNCLKDLKCGSLDKLSPESIERNLGLIISSGHMAKLVEMNHTDLLIKKGYKNLLLKAQTENLLKVVSNNSDDIKNAAKKFEEMSQGLKDHQDSMATNFTSLIQSNAECKSDKEAINSELESLKQELADIKGKLEGNKDCTDDTVDLEMKFNALFLKEFIEFKKKLIE
jgi:hypothetical protein